MAGIKVTKAAGLYTSDNPYGSVPEGSLAQADNVVIRNKDVIEPRRGQRPLDYSLPDGYNITEIAFFDEGTFVNAFDNGSGEHVLARDTGSSFSTLTPGEDLYAEPPLPFSSSAPMRMKFASAGQNLFFTSAKGINRVATGDATTFTIAGVEEPFEIRGDSSVAISKTVPLAGNPGASGAWLPPDSAVSYRAVLGVRDEHNNFKLSAPTGRMVVYNPPSSSVATGGLVRTGGSTVTVTTAATHAMRVGEKFSLVAVSSADVNFAAGTYTVASVPSSTTFTYTDPGSNLSSGQPYTVSPGTKYTAFSLLLPRYITTNHFIQLHRTETVDSYSIDPGDEHFLVYERQLTADEVTNQIITFTDITPETFLSSTPLYTNPDTGDGIDVAHDLPPHAKDICFLNNRLWAANTSRLHRIELQILGVGSPDGIQSGDILTIGDVPYRFGGGTSYAVGVDIYSDSSSSINVVNTARALVHAINETNYASGNLRAKYISGSDEYGRILIEAVYPGVNINTDEEPAIYLGASRPASFQPVLPQVSTISSISGGLFTTSSAHGLATGDIVRISCLAPDAADVVGRHEGIIVANTTEFSFIPSFVTNASATYYINKEGVASDNDEQPHGICFSQLQEPEAFPVLNYLTVGTKSSPIQRIVPLKDKLFVFKDEGIFTVSGEHPFRVDPLDTTVSLLAPDSVVAVSNRIFALTTQGVVAVTESGVAIVSRPIENDILPLLYNADPALRAYYFGVGYEAERQYILWAPDDSAEDGFTLRGHIYNTLSNTWTRRTDWAIAGRVSPDNYLYLTHVDGDFEIRTLSKERKSFDRTDYADAEVAATVVSSTATTATLSAPAASVGDFFVRDDDSRGVITAVNGNTITFANETTVPPAAGSATIYAGYDCTVVYNPQTGGAPGTSKQFSKATLHFGGSPEFELGYITSKTELNDTTENDLIALGGFAYENATRCLPVRNQRAGEIQLGFSIRNAWGKWKLYGYTLEADGMSERVAR